MGAAPSSPSSDAHSPPELALHVLRVAPGSPASQTSLEPFFDFIVGVSGFDASAADITEDAALDQLEALVARGMPLELVVWSSKTRERRLVPVVPSRDNGRLGLSMRVFRPGAAHDNVWHVLDVLEGSPAESAGLVPFGDWIVGWSGGPLCAESDLYEVVEAEACAGLRLLVRLRYDAGGRACAQPAVGRRGAAGMRIRRRPRRALLRASHVMVRHRGNSARPARWLLLVPALLGALLGYQSCGRALFPNSFSPPHAGRTYMFGILHRIPVVPTSASAHNAVIFRPPSTVPASESGSGSAVVVPSDRDEDFVY